MKNTIRANKNLIILLLFSIFAVAPLTSPGYFFNAHDADHSVFFLVEFDAAIRDGALWPRWGPDHALGYGYPLWLLYAPLAYFVAEGFHLLGLGFTAAVKATWISGFLLGGWGMFALLRRWWGRTPAGEAAALIGGLIYVYAPYHLVNIYVRAALAEFSALAWFPWVLLTFDRLPDKKPENLGRAIALAAVALAGLLLTHTGTILLFTPLLFAYLLFLLLRATIRAGRGRRWPSFWRISLQFVAAGLLAAGLAAIFLLPMLLEQRYIVQSQWIHGSYGYRFHFVYPSQLLDPFWGFGYSDDPTGPNDGMSFQLGPIGVGLAFAAAVAGLRRGSQQRDRTAFFLLATLVILALMLPAAQPFWDAFGPAALIQFPWRLLGLAAFALAILAGSAVASLPNSQLTIDNSQLAIIYPLALLVVLASLPFSQPQYTAIEPIDESAQSIIRFETSYPDMIGVTSYAQAVPTDSPLVAQYLAGESLQKATLLAGTGQVETVRVGGASVTAQVQADEPVTVLFYTYDFPGWQAKIDGQPVSHRPEPPYGLIAVDVPAGRHTVAIRHGATSIRTAGALISALSLLIAAAIFILRRDDQGRIAPTKGASP